MVRERSGAVVEQVPEMTLFEAITTRRSIGKLKETEIPKQLIEEVLEAATWAPSHYNTQPWRFIVMSGEGRKLLGEGYTNVAAAKQPELTAEEMEELRAKEYMKANRAPVIIAAVCSPSDDPRALPEEELAASHCAVQNLLLAAHAKGLGAVWRSGASMYHEAMKETFGLAEQEKLIALVFLGYSDMPDKTSKRKSFQEVTSWVEA